MDKVRRQMKRSGMPSMADIRVAWSVAGVQHLAGTPGVSTVQAPATLRTVFRGDRLIVYAFVNDCFEAFLKVRMSLCGFTSRIYRVGQDTYVGFCAMMHLHSAKTNAMFSPHRRHSGDSRSTPS